MPGDKFEIGVFLLPPSVRYIAVFDLEVKVSI